MSDFYGNMAEVALQKIEQFGRDITIRRKTADTVDPVTGTVIPGAEMVGTIKAVILSASKGTIEAFDNRLVNGSLIDEKLRYVLAAAKGAPFEPKSVDMLDFDGATWTVLGCTPLNPAGTPLLYPMGVMRT